MKPLLTYVVVSLSTIRFPNNRIPQMGLSCMSLAVLTISCLSGHALLVWRTSNDTNG